MSRSILVYSFVLGVGVVALTGCGPSASDQSSAGAAPETASTSAASEALPVVASTINSTKLDGAQPSKACALDSVNGEVPSGAFTAVTSGTTSFRGWVVDAATAAPGKLTLVLKGAQTYGLPAQTGQPRPDVAKALNSAAAASAGYMFTSKLAHVAGGTYIVLVYVNSSAGSTLCDTGKHVIVRS